MAVVVDVCLRFLILLCVSEATISQAARGEEMGQPFPSEYRSNLHHVVQLVTARCSGAG